MRAIIFYIFLLLSISSCTKHETELNGFDLVRYCENPENGLQKTKKMDAYEYTLQYRSIDYVLATEFKDKRVGSEVIEKRMKEIEGMEYYQLRIKTMRSSQDPLVYGITNQQDYFARDMEYSYNFSQNLSLVSCTDSLPCTLYSFVQTRGLAPYIDLLFGFQKTKTNCDKEIRIYDHVLGTGNIVFTILADDIKRSPKLKR